MSLNDAKYFLRAELVIKEEMGFEHNE